MIGKMIYIKIHLIGIMIFSDQFIFQKRMNQLLWAKKIYQFTRESLKFMKKIKNKPIARLVSYVATGVEPNIMGIGPAKAIPIALKKAGLKIKDIEQIELNEAFSAQALAVIKNLNLNQDIVNVNGGAIALGHPLGMTGAKLSISLFNEMKKRKQKYGMVTACVGGGQGVCGVFENLTL